MRTSHVPARMKTLLNRLRLLTSRDHNTTPTPLAICGLGYEHYRIQSVLADSRDYTVLAIFDDYPWNHATQVKGVRVYYPVEALSLARRHGIQAIVYCQKSDLAIFDERTYSALTGLGLTLIRLDPEGDVIATLARQLPN